MGPGLERISGMVFNQPQLYHPGKAEEFITAFGPRMLGRPVVVVNEDEAVRHVAFQNGRPSAGILGDRMGRAYDRAEVLPFDMIDGVAVIPIEGTLVQKGAWTGQNSGETSYQGLVTQISRAEKSGSVRAVVFEIDSFGGMVNGAFEAAKAIRSLSKAKPTIAILTDYAYSAGYLLASQARQIVAPEFGGAGSIGVVMMHVDLSGNLEQDAIKITIIRAGKKKAEGNPYEPLPADLQAKWQAECEVMRQRFAEVVGKARGRRFNKAAALKTEAEAFTSEEAARLGIIDAIADPVETFDAFIKQVNQ